MKASPTRAILLSVGLAALAFLLYIGVWPFLTGGSSMARLCEGIHPGDDVALVRLRAGAAGYVVSKLAAGQLLIVDRAAMGRHLCEIRLTGDRVGSSRYVHND
jgi:hypothetical protein